MKLLNMFLLFFIFTMTYADETNDDGLDMVRETNDMSYETRLSAESIISDEELELVYKDVEKTFVDAGHHEAAESLRAEWAEVAASISRRRLGEEQIGSSRTLGLGSWRSTNSLRPDPKGWQVNGGATGWCREKKKEAFGLCIYLFSEATEILSRLDTFYKAQGADICYQADSKSNEDNEGKCSLIGMKPCDSASWDTRMHDDTCIAPHITCTDVNWNLLLTWGQAFVNIITMIFTGGASAAGKTATFTLAKNAAQNTLMRQVGIAQFTKGLGAKLLKVKPSSIRANCMASIKLAAKHASKTKGKSLEWFNFSDNLKDHIFKGGMAKELMKKLAEEMIWMFSIGEPRVLKSIVTHSSKIEKAAWELGAVVDPTGIVAILKYYEDRKESPCNFERPPALSQQLITQLESFGGAIDYYEAFAENSICRFRKGYIDGSESKLTNPRRGYIDEDLGMRFASPQDCAQSEVMIYDCKSRTFQHNAETQSCECCEIPAVVSDPKKKSNTYKLTIPGYKTFTEISTGGTSVEFTVAIVGDLTPVLTSIDGKFPGKWSVMREGALQFSDRNYFFQDVPSYLIGAKYWQGPCHSNGASVGIKTSGTLYLLASHGSGNNKYDSFVTNRDNMRSKSIPMRTTSFKYETKFEQWIWNSDDNWNWDAYVCPTGYVFTFPGSPKGGCPHQGKTKASATSKQKCAEECDKDLHCSGFDWNIYERKCFLNDFCDRQDDDDDYLSCRKNKCPEGWETTFGRSENGECNHSGGKETLKGKGLTTEQCAAKCANDVTCLAFDIHPDDGRCYSNTKCSKQDKGDGFLSCTRKAPRHCPSGYERRAGYSTKILGNENAHDALKRKVRQKRSDTYEMEKPELDADSLRIVDFKDLPSITANDIYDCAEQCRSKTRCQAFEYSEDSRYCYILTDPETESSSQELDFMFCAKPMNVQQRLEVLGYKYVGKGLCQNKNGGTLYHYYSDKLSMSECINFCEQETYCMGIAMTNPDHSNPNRCYMYGEKKPFDAQFFNDWITDNWVWSHLDRGEGFLTRSDGQSNARCYANPDYNFELDWTLLRSNVECNDNSNEISLGKKASVEECAKACKNRDGCTNFIYGKGSKAGSCWDEGITASACTTWQKDEYDFYLISQIWKPRDDNQCVKDSGKDWEDRSCNDIAYCRSDPRVMLRCCPESCGTGVFNEVMCKNTNGPGVCKYPNGAQNALQFLGKTAACSPDSPCGLCQGFCDRDTDCQGDLTCYKGYSIHACEIGKASVNEGKHGYCVPKRPLDPYAEVRKLYRKNYDETHRLKVSFAQLSDRQLCNPNLSSCYGKDYETAQSCGERCREDPFCSSFSWADRSIKYGQDYGNGLCCNERIEGGHVCDFSRDTTFTHFYQFYEGCFDMLPIPGSNAWAVVENLKGGDHKYRCGDFHCCNKGYEWNVQKICVPTQYCGAACTLTFLGRNIEIAGEEKLMSGLKTLDKCAEACMKDSKCFGIDFGKLGRKNVCYHSTENTEETKSNVNYDAWKKTCDYMNGKPDLFGEDLFFTNADQRKDNVGSSILKNQAQFSTLSSFLAIVGLVFTIFFAYRSCKKTSGYVDIPIPSETEI